MVKFAYLDKIGLLKISESEATAKEFAKFNGRVMATKLPMKDGCPAMFNKATRVMDTVWVFAVGEAYFEPRQVQGEELRTKRYPELIDIFALYRDLMGKEWWNEITKIPEKPEISTVIDPE